MLEHRDIEKNNKISIKDNSNLELSFINLEVEKILGKKERVVQECNPELKFDIIKSYLKENNSFFKGYMLLFDEFKEKKYFSDKIEIYIEKFLDYIIENLKISLEYEPIVSQSNGIELKEGLLRVESLNNGEFKNYNLLESFDKLGYGFKLFQYILFVAFNDLTTGRISLPITININKSDLLHKDFLSIIKKYEVFFDFELSNKDGKIYFELLEKQDPLNDIDQITKVKNALNNLGYVIALDDLLHDEQNIDEFLSEIELLKPALIKITGGSFNSLFELYTKYYPYIELNRLKNIFLTIQNEKNIPIIAEQIEEGEVDFLYFITEILGINLIQGYIFTKNKGNIDSYVKGKGDFEHNTKT